ITRRGDVEHAVVAGGFDGVDLIHRRWREGNVRRVDRHDVDAVLFKVDQVVDTSGEGLVVDAGGGADFDGQDGDAGGDGVDGGGDGSAVDEVVGDVVGVSEEVPAV